MIYISRWFTLVQWFNVKSIVYIMMIEQLRTFLKM